MSTRNSKKVSLLEAEAKKKDEELEELKKKLHAFTEEKSNKRKRGSNLETWNVKENEALTILIKKKAGDKLWDQVKFLANEDELNQALLMILKTTQEWKKLKDLPNEEALMDQIDGRSVLPGGSAAICHRATACSSSYMAFHSRS